MKEWVSMTVVLADGTEYPMGPMQTDEHGRLTIDVTDRLPVGYDLGDAREVRVFVAAAS